MARCVPCCLRKSMRISNVVLLLFGIGLIVYSLWLQKMWTEGLSELSSASRCFPQPWFIYTCFGVGIAVFLSTLCSRIIDNCISKCILGVYIVFSCCLILVEVVAVIVTIFFKINLATEIAQCIRKHLEFENFVDIHVKMCRWIALLILIAQVTAICPTTMLWAIGIESTTHDMSSDVPNFTQSFLVPESPGPTTSVHYCTGCGDISSENLQQNFLLRIWTSLCLQFRRNYYSLQ